MSQSDIQALRRIPLEAMSQGRIEVIDEVISPDLQDHAETPGFPPGLEGFKQFVRSFRRAFPDLKYEVVHEIEQGDLVVQHLYAAGTMQGEFMGMQPTGKKACWSEIHIIRMRDGKAVEHWGVADMMTAMQQLGLAEMPGMERAA